MSKKQDRKIIDRCEAEARQKNAMLRGTLYFAPLDTTFHFQYDVKSKIAALIDSPIKRGGEDLPTQWKAPDYWRAHTRLERNLANMMSKIDVCITSPE